MIKPVMFYTITARLAAGVIACVAGAASFEHIASVGLSVGERVWVAYAIPIAIDGLIVVGVAAALEDRKRNLKVHPWAQTALITGIAATLAANLASAEQTVTAKLVAVAAPVAFLISVEVLTRTHRAGRVDVSHGDSVYERSVTPPETSLSVSLPAEPPGELAREQRPDLEPQANAQPVRIGEGKPGPGRPSTRDRVLAARASYPEASTNRIAELAGVAPSTARRHLNGSGE